MNLPNLTKPFFASQELNANLILLSNEIEHFLLNNLSTKHLHPSFIKGLYFGKNKPNIKKYNINAKQGIHKKGIIFSFLTYLSL